MGFLVSPGVEVKEIDLTNVIPAVSTSIGGFMGEFRWGPAGEAVTVSSEKELASYYGTPNDATAVSFLTAGSFLKYGNALKVSRAISSAGASNATVNKPGATGDTTSLPLVKNYTDFKAKESSLASNYIFIARYPGSIANGVTIYYAFGGAAINENYRDLFTNNETDVSSWSAGGLAEDAGTLKDEIHFVIVDSLGKFTGSPGTVLEVWDGLSVFSDAKKPDGSSNYYVNVINENSSYIFITTANLSTNFKGNLTRAAAYATSPTWTQAIISNDDVLGASDSQSVGSKDDGTDGTVSEGDYAVAAEVFRDASLIDVNLLFTSSSPDSIGSGEDTLIEIAMERKDCVAFISAPLNVSLQTTDASRINMVRDKFDSATSTSYAVFDSTPLYVYNKYADKYIWIPASGHMAGLCANTDNVAEPWFSPAGYNRGNILGVTKLAYNPNQSNRDELYKARINPIVSFPGQGILLFGDKTAQAKPSAFDRINVRRLFITLEKAISTASKYQLFELNDEFTRAMFRNMVEPFLREVKGRRGVTDFLVICDETNNTGEVIDTNRFVADIYIKPARSINFITLNFIATRTGVQFSEIVGK
jgi:phage tail sheath protein FI